MHSAGGGVGHAAGRSRKARHRRRPRSRCVGSQQRPGRRDCPAAGAAGEAYDDGAAGPVARRGRRSPPAGSPPPASTRWLPRGPPSAARGAPERGAAGAPSPRRRTSAPGRPTRSRAARHTTCPPPSSAPSRSATAQAPRGPSPRPSAKSRGGAARSLSTTPSPTPAWPGPGASGRAGRRRGPTGATVASWRMRLRGVPPSAPICRHKRGLHQPRSVKPTRSAPSAARERRRH